MSCKDVQEKIDVYLDNELTLSDRRDVEAHIDECEHCQLALESARALNFSVQNIAYAHTPSALQRKIKKDLKESADKEGVIDAAMYSRLQLFSFAGASSVLASIAAWMFISFTANLTLQTKFIDELTQAHVQSLMVDHVTDIKTSDNHTVKPWFSGKLDFSPRVKDLSAENFPLVGGRLEYLHKQIAAALVYKKRSHFINVFIYRDNDGVSQCNAYLQETQRQSYNLVSWCDQSLRYWAISDLNKKELKQFSSLLAL